MFKSPLDLRWERAKAIDKAGALKVTSLKDDNGKWVWSALAYGSRKDPYNTQVRMDTWSGFQTGSCTCPDYVSMFAYVYLNHPYYSCDGVPLYKGRLVCKHMLALSLKAYLELEATLLQ